MGFVPPATEPRLPKRNRFRRMAGRIGLAVLVVPFALILLFRFVPPPITPLMLLRLAEGYGLHREWVPYDRISPYMADAVVASEDNLFCREKSGFDTVALADQIAVWRDGERPRGASTITMQTARNLLLWPGRDIVRKLIEAWLTPQIALLWPKKRVLEVYLNIIEFGPGIVRSGGGGTAVLRPFGGDADARRCGAAGGGPAGPAPLVGGASQPLFAGAD